MDKNLFNKPWLIFLAGLVVIIVIITFSGKKLNQKSGNQPSSAVLSSVKINHFNSSSEITEYWSHSSSAGFRTPLLDQEMTSSLRVGSPESKTMAQDSSGQAVGSSNLNSNFSATNVQVAGIDEPDIVKTDGQNLFMSSRQAGYGSNIEPFIDQLPTSGPQPKISAPSAGEERLFAPIDNPTIEIVRALPADTLKKLGTIKRPGDLLLVGKILVVLNNDQISGFDISQPEQAKEIWTKKLSASTVITSRLLDNKIYVVLRDNNSSAPECPYQIVIGDNLAKIACRDIYRPASQLSQPVLYSAITLDPSDGKSLQAIGFVAESSQTVVYMSPQALYLTYGYQEDQTGLLAEFANQDGADLFSSEALAKINRLVRYDLSTAAKQIELQQILERNYSNLSADQRLKQQTELGNRLGQFLKNRSRSLISTGIVKIPLANFQIDSSGSVSGGLLNQFALDEYQGNLRLATTIDNTSLSWLYGWPATDQQSSSTVYVLGPKLNRLGQLSDLGQSERIYAVRFIADQGYVVTFRQTDPLYVIDLSNPNQPQKQGELKIPGYSSYLHPLGNHLLFGLGMENGQVKVSLFDTSNSAKPLEKASYKLNEYYSEAGADHHAFYADTDNQTVFIPASGNGYLLSYKDSKISLVKAFSNLQARRAVRINNYLYLIRENGVTVVERNSGQEISSLSF